MGSFEFSFGDVSEYFFGSSTGGSSYGRGILSVQGECIDQADHEYTDSLGTCAEYGLRISAGCTEGTYSHALQGGSGSVYASSLSWSSASV